MDEEPETEGEYKSTRETAEADTTSTTSDNTSHKAESGAHSPTELLRQLCASTESAIKTSEEKLGLAVYAYDMVDRHIRRLDGDMHKNEQCLHAGLSREIMQTYEETRSKGDRPPRIAPRIAPEAEFHQFWSALMLTEPTKCLDYLKDYLTLSPENLLAVSESEEKRSRKRKKHTDEKTPAVDFDPSEPRYCYCNGVSYGEMVACENDECPREWVRTH